MCMFLTFGGKLENLEKNLESNPELWQPMHHKDFVSCFPIKKKKKIKTETAAMQKGSKKIIQELFVDTGLWLRQQ